MTETLIETIRLLTELPLEQEEKLIEIAKPNVLVKGEYFIREGQYPRQFGFICKGLFRYYYADNNGNEFTKGFFPEGSFLSSYSAMVQQRASYFNIEALESAEILIFDYHQWIEISKQHSCWSDFLIAILEKAFMKKESRERELLLFDAEARYRLFMDEYPGLIKRVKQHIIASYLGITPVALSRIRKKMGLINIGQ